MRLIIGLLLFTVWGTAHALHTWVDKHGQRHVSTVPPACIDAGRLASACAPTNSNADYKARLRDEQAQTEQRARYRELNRERDRRSRALRRKQRDLHDTDTDLDDLAALHQALADYLEADRRLDRHRDREERHTSREAREELRVQLNDEIDRREAWLRQQAFEAERLAELRRTEAMIRAEERRRSRLQTLQLFSDHRRPGPRRLIRDKRPAPTYGTRHDTRFERLRRSGDKPWTFDRIER